MQHFDYGYFRMKKVGFHQFVHNIVKETFYYRECCFKKVIVIKIVAILNKDDIYNELLLTKETTN